MRFYKGLRINNLYQIYSNSFKQCSSPLHLLKPTSSTYCSCYKNINCNTQQLRTYKSCIRRFHISTHKYEKEETINVPSFPDSVSEGDVRWIKSIGDTINVDDVICEIETDKTAVPVPSPIQGILSAQLVEEGSKVVAHQPLFKISDAKPTTTETKKPIQTEQQHKDVKEEISPKKSEESAGFAMQELQSVEVPQFPESVSEGDVKWVKRVGDQVRVDDVICEIETDKTAVPVPSPFDGILQEQLFQDGARVKSKELLCKIRLSPTKSSAHAEKQAAPVVDHISTPTPKQVPKKSESFSSSDDVNIPSGFKQKPQFFPPSSNLKEAPFGGKSQQKQVSEPSSHSIQTHITGTRTELRVKMNRMRKRIAERLKEAQNTAAMLTTFNEIDMSTVMELRNKFKDEFLKKHGVKLGFMSPFVLAAVSALKQQPVVNAYITPEGEIVYRDFIDISVAVSTPKGLVVPVMRSCEHMTCADIEKTINALGEKARKGNLAIEDMDGGTFTISNGGVFGSLYGTPIINLPQSAILGMHAIVDRPVAINNKVEIRPMMYVALTYDHRLIDGREAVLFLRKIKSVIEQPASILLDL